jgi:hypothetical protein
LYFVKNSGFFWAKIELENRRNIIRRMPEGLFMLKKVILFKNSGLKLKMGKGNLIILNY